MAAIDAEDVAQWVEAANAIFDASGIRFLFDAEQDFLTLDSTPLNYMDADLEDEERFLANSVAARYPGRLVVYFRHGPPGRGAREAFSSPDCNFVAMPDFDQEICGHHYRSMLAHEIGHYLGLEHTFAESFEMVEDAEAYFRRYGNVAGVFDGDELDDTPPDPFVESLLCERPASLVLGGVTFPLPQENVMSYYADATGLSSEQTSVARWLLSLRQRNAMALPVNEGAPFAVEAERLEVRQIRGGSTETESMTRFAAHRWEGGDQLRIDAEADGEVELVFHAPRDGIYRVDVYMAYAPDYGQIQLSLDGEAMGEPFDAYGPLVTTSGPVELGEMDLSAGEHTLGFMVVGKNAESSGYSFGIDCLSLVPLD
jgi:hypothetical protein